MSWTNFNPHSPCGERRNSLASALVQCHFNPHSPCGERPAWADAPEAGVVFQSTLPMRGATLRDGKGAAGLLISIHTPHAGSDRISDQYNRYLRDFNPHSPCGERRCTHLRKFISDTNFNPHSPCGERRTRCPWSCLPDCISIHTPHAGSDLDVSHGRGLV